ncbi:MAG: hypothetical protein WAM60_20140, partial [Candidatus Promineifilaceae bacterium]
MKFRRSKNVVSEETQGLLLTGPDDEVWMTFPEEVVEAVRKMISRVMRNEGFPKSLVLLSAVRQEGVTFLSRAMGTVLA